MRRFLFTVLLSFIALISKTAILPPGFIETPLATGLDPTGMVLAPDGRIFLIEKYGTVRVVENGMLLPDPMIVLDVDNYNERGLSGILLHPDFTNNGYIYVYYTLKNSGINRLSRITAVGNYADPASETVLLDGDPLNGTVHNGGAMAIGADGKLYLAVGDGSAGHLAQSTQSLLGKILRLNIDGSIPTDNPYYNQNSGKYRAIYASGFRNPFSLTIQPGTGKIFVCDVGSEFWEEINVAEPGADYGWNAMEGKKTWQTMPDNYRDPFYTYSHAQGCAIVGAAFYNPSTAVFPAQYIGKFFFADYCMNHIKMLDPATGIVTGTFATQIDRPLVLLTGSDGALYYISRGGQGGGSESDNTSSNEGMLWKVEYVGNGAPVFSVHPKNTLVSTGEEVSLSAYANGTPPIAYAWERDGQPVPGADSSTLLLTSVGLSDSGAVFRCIVHNNFGQVSSNAATLKVTSNLRPMPVITSPQPGFKYSAGVPVVFAGFATDPETGTLTPDDLNWRIDLHHDEHVHPGLAATPGIENGVFSLPTIGETAENVWIRILLSAKDPAGLSRTTHLNIYPEKSVVKVETSPPAIPVRIDGKTYNTPFESGSVRGLRRLIEAPQLETKGDTIYVFNHWNDGTAIPSLTLYPADSVASVKGYYTPIRLGIGTGLTGYYYNGDGIGTFGDSLFSRIDTMINFDWKNAAPDTSMDEDNFAIRWEGFVEPVFTGYYTFIAATDDGCRLWVNGQQIIDFWIEKGPYDVFGHAYLEKGKHYPLTMEYYESGQGAQAKLYWATSTIPKTLVPKSQLFPRNPGYKPGVPTDFQWTIAPNPVVSGNLRLAVISSHRESLRCTLVDASGRLVRTFDHLSVEEPNQIITLPLTDIPAGWYWLELEGSYFVGKTAKAFVKG